MTSLNCSPQSLSCRSRAFFYAALIHQIPLQGRPIPPYLILFAMAEEALAYPLGFLYFGFGCFGEHLLMTLLLTTRFLLGPHLFKLESYCDDLICL